VDDSGFIRIAIPAKFNWKPGQHCFLRFTGFGLIHAISSHPFTICSSPSLQADELSELVFYIRPQGGFTRKLHAHALEHPGSSLPVIVDGPYGGITLQKYNNADHILVVAGGSGAGWCLPFIEQFVRYGSRSHDSHSNTKETVHIESSSIQKPSSLRVVLATRDTTSRTWFLSAVDELLDKYAAKSKNSGFHVQVYLTGDAAREADLPSKISEDNASPNESSSTAGKIEVPGHGHVGAVPGREYEGRPQLPSIVLEEASKIREGGRSLSVFVCGPITMQNDVRNAVAAENLHVLKDSRSGGVYLHSEHFSWA
jgi:NAD(P)H-flavin reductase